MGWVGTQYGDLSYGRRRRGGPEQSREPSSSAPPKERHWQISDREVAFGCIKTWHLRGLRENLVFQMLRLAVAAEMPPLKPQKGRASRGAIPSWSWRDDSSPLVAYHGASPPCTKQVPWHLMRDRCFRAAILGKGTGSGRTNTAWF